MITVCIHLNAANVRASALRQMQELAAEKQLALISGGGEIADTDPTPPPPPPPPPDEVSGEKKALRRHK